MAIIYKVKNTINGKCYIGQTSQTLEKRMSRHLSTVKSGKLNKFYNAIRKYGPASFEWSVVLECPDEDKYIQEIITIEAVDSYFNGYNSTTGGEGARGTKLSDEQRRKISEAAKRKPAATAEYRLKMSEVKRNRFRGNTNKSGEPNVSYKSNRFVVEVSRNKKRYYVGCYATLKEATIMRDEFLKRLKAA